MSLSGDLKHFPIIDIIQLLHGSRKSGVFRLTCEKGESQLVFHDGDLVSANFLNNRVRIGQVLVSSGAISEEQLALALDIQKNAGDDRKPLVITLLEHNMVDETAAYNGIESLIEMTIVEVLTWKEGHFSLDITSSDNPDGYHFSRTKFPQRVVLNSQGILMESLRIFDEKVRDGTMDEILSIAGMSSRVLDAELSGSRLSVITSDGIDLRSVPSTLQQLLEEQRNLVQRSGEQSYLEVDTVKRLIVEEYPSAVKELKRQLLSLLAGPITGDKTSVKPPDVAVIVITKSPMLSTMFRSICSRKGVYAVASDNITSLDINIRLLLHQAVQLVVFLDVPHDNAGMDTIKICMDLQKYPQASVVLVACSHFWSTKGLQALSSGIRSIIPRPCKQCAEEPSAQQAVAFCSELGTFLGTLSSEYNSSDEQRFFACISRLRSCTNLMEMTDALLEYLIEVFERAIVFMVAESDLGAERSFGVKADKCEGVAPLPGLHIPRDDQPIFEDAIKTGQMYYGYYSDSSWSHQLYRLIGRPDTPEVLVFPVIRAKIVVAFIYADFGSKPALSPSLNFLEALMQYTTAQITVSAYRQKLKSMLEQRTQDSAGS